MKFGVGQAIPRLEDARLITGQGRYTDDIDPGTGLAVAFLRAPMAHARRCAAGGATRAVRGGAGRGRARAW